MLVVGAAGSVGCSTVALAVATAGAAGSTFGGTRPVIVRVVECSSAPSSGLAAASTAELGRHESGWVQGMREAVLLERTGAVLVGPDEVAVPVLLGDGVGVDNATGRSGRGRSADATDGSSGAEALTVIDTGWDIGQLVATASWVGHHTRTAPVVIVVARPTIPGFRRLEAALELLDHHNEPEDRAGDAVSPVTLVAVVGGRRRRWAKGVEHSAGPRTRDAVRENRLHEIPEDRQLAVTGLDSTPLPPALLAAAGHLLHQALWTLVAGTPPIGQTTGRHHDVDDLPQLPGPSPGKSTTRR